MTESEKVFAFEKRLKQLKEEEKLILKILKDVQTQLKKYEVEELQTSSEVIRREDDESESDESVDGNPQEILKVLDCAKLINDTSLNLGLNKIFGNASDNDEDSEEESLDSD
ncbi:hypothetical protein RUM44_000752 [Polyplax serrata]|uniref:Uncharacterized protein n=1 Tax=Polyplax serrata TaxID=468196 RepID=A0ABR1B655_POLSC